MPNYKLSPKIVDHMIAIGYNLCERRVSHMQTGFPISRDKIQAAILPAKWREVILEMHHDGLSALWKTNNLHADIEELPGIERPPRLDLSVGYDQQFVYCDHKNIIFDVSILAPHEIAAFAKWTNTAVQERRLAGLAKRTITVFLKTPNFSGTSGHVIARWPALTMLIDTKVGWSDHERDILAGWKRKFQEPVRNLKPYAWPPGDPWYAKHQKAMRLTETILTSAQMLPTEIKDTAEVKASVVSWRPLPGDLDKP